MTAAISHRRIVAAMLYSTVLASGLAAPAYAQTVPDTPTATPDAADPSDEGAIVVTGTRVDRSGYKAPTPVTSLSSEDLTRNATTTIADALNRLPQFGSATTSNAGFQGGGAGGANYVNLRDLGSGRTLVLLNNERVVPTTLTNDVNLNTLPMALIKRIDVVTGGASAAYGSDAVAGVVNLILDTRFTGFKASAQYRNRWDGGYPGYKADAAFGTAFAGDRGHIVASASYFNNPDFFLLGQTKWNRGTALFLNPAYTPTNSEPMLIHRDNLGQAQQTQGGVITSGLLAGIQFLGPDATLGPFIPGLVSGVIATGGNTDSAFLDRSPVGLPQHGVNLFGYADYELGGAVTAHVEASYGKGGGESGIGEYQRANNITITADNPYIPAAIKTQMTALGLTSFLLGSNNANLGNPKNSGVVYPNDRKFLRLSAGLDGKFGDGWSWSAYYQHGAVDTRQRWLNDVYIPYYNLAIDAVAAPAGNSAGIAAGTVVCRSTLTDPTNGCKPLNLFGVGVASPEAIAYVTPVPFTEVDLRQDVVSASVQGEPFSTWAGPVSLALGAEYRKESGISYSDALTYTRKFAYGNALPFTGKVNVKEAFAEAVVPLVRDQPWAREFDLNGAVRVTDYSTSGRVVTWKLGVTNDIAGQYRIRATISRDIRAPNLSELFTQAVSGGRAVADPFNPGQTPSILATTRGNPDLKPEVARTITVGIVATPDWMRGFTASVDYYYVKIRGAIATITAEDELKYCFQGQQEFCSLITRNSAGVLTEIVSVPTNTAALTTSGIDVNAQYLHDLGAGRLDLSVRTNYRFYNKIVQNGLVVDNAGSLSRTTVGGAGQPKFKALAAITYDQGPFSGTIQTRLIGPGKLVNTWTAKDVDDNHVPWIGYFDIHADVDVTPQVTLFAGIDNLFDKAPPSVPQAYYTATVYYTPGSAATVYDLIGRQFTVGARARF